MKITDQRPSIYFHIISRLTRVTKLLSIIFTKKTLVQNKNSSVTNNVIIYFSKPYNFLFFFSSKIKLLYVFIPTLITLFWQRTVLHNWTYKSCFRFVLYLWISEYWVWILLFFIKRKLSVTYKYTEISVASCVEAPSFRQSLNLGSGECDGDLKWEARQNIQ
jgi:hypothetical protein